MRPLCVIPARAGSKRLPRKNILELDGKPMLVYSIEAARESGVFDGIYVSTEDREIARVAQAHGALVHRRPEELAGDLTSATDVCLDALQAVQVPADKYGAIICLQPSSPLRSADDIRGAWKLFCDTGADFVVSVTPIDPHYFHWAVCREGDWWHMFFGDKFLVERPLLPPMYRPNGSIKIGRVGPVLESRSFFGPKLEAYETPAERSIHVAEQIDFQIADFLMRARRKEGSNG